MERRPKKDHLHVLFNSHSSIQCLISAAEIRITVHLVSAGAVLHCPDTGVKPEGKIKSRMVVAV